MHIVKLLICVVFVFSLQMLLKDISVVSQVFSLPVLEPLTPARLKNVVTVAMSYLFAAVTAATATSIVALASSIQMKGSASTKDDEIDVYAMGIVQKAVSQLYCIVFSCMVV